MFPPALFARLLLEREPESEPELALIGVAALSGGVGFGSRSSSVFVVGFSFIPNFFVLSTKG